MIFFLKIENTYIEFHLSLQSNKNRESLHIVNSSNLIKNINLQLSPEFTNIED